MIKIKDYILNENEIKWFEKDNEDIKVVFVNDAHIYIRNTTFEDIEWNYGSQDNQDVASKYLVDRLKLLEDGCIKMQSSLVRLREENERLKRK